MIKNIKDLLPGLLQHQDNWKLQLLSSWPTIFGPLSSKVHLEKIHDDTLVLGVQDSCWLQELYLLSAVLLKTINETLDAPRIKHLRFKTIGIKKSSQPQQQKRIPVPQRKVILSANEQRALLNIKDEQLRSALKDFLIRCYQEKNI